MTMITETIECRGGFCDGLELTVGGTGTVHDDLRVRVPVPFADGFGARDYTYRYVETKRPDAHNIRHIYEPL